MRKIATNIQFLQLNVIFLTTNIHQLNIVFLVQVFEWQLTTNKEKTNFSTSYSNPQNMANKKSSCKPLVKSNDLRFQSLL